MAKAFLLNDKDKNYFKIRTSALAKAMRTAGVTQETISESDVEKIRKHLPKKEKFNPERILKKLDPLLAGKRFSVMYIAKYDISPREWSPGENLKENEVVINGQLSLAYREWYYTKHGPDEKLPFGMPQMHPIEEGTPAYNLLESASSWEGKGNFITPSESEVLQLQELLGLQEYPFLSLNEGYVLELLAAVCYEIVQQGLGATKISTNLPAQNLFYNMPDSPASDLVYQVFGAGPDLGDLPARKKQYSHGTKMRVEESGKKRKITLESEKNKVVVDLADIDKLTKNNKPAKKMFILALVKANEQALHNGALTKDYVSFSLQELIDIGFYKTPQSARKGFTSAMNTLADVKVGGEFQRTKRERVTVVGLHPFRYGTVDKSQCVIKLESEFNWAFLAQFFTIIPRYYFKLSNKASDLLYFIFFLARQHTRDIQEQGHFNISFRAIQSRLQLPDETKTKNPQRDIKDAIDEALQDIEDNHTREYNNADFALSPFCDENAPIGKYLDEGYLQVSFSGAFAESFIEISKKTAKSIDEAKKRQARITEKAVAINAAKALEKGNK